VESGYFVTNTVRSIAFVLRYHVLCSLRDRTVLITGGATGIGACLVEQFAAQGARVGFLDIDADAGTALAQRLAGAQHAPLFVPTDLTDIAALERGIDAVRQHFGPIAVLLNNAAMTSATRWRTPRPRVGTLASRSTSSTSSLPPRTWPPTCARLGLGPSSTLAR
jgi:NAD(P)-dependent dehydrogenase (short-subunit alcohol dehydrogenase family)